MSETESSGAATPAAETVNPPSAPTNPTTNQPPSTFGNTRGSGLARGKRPTGQTAQAASAAPATDYKPTAVSILTAPTEYKNPFAPPAPVDEANAPAPTPPPAAEAAPPATPSAPGQPSSQEPAQADSEQAAEPAAEAEAKAELKILPPEAPKRVEHNWESRSFRSVAAEPGSEAHRAGENAMPGARPRRDERPVFRPDRERRGDRPKDFRTPGGEPGRTGPSEVRRPAEVPPAPAAAEKKAGGLFGWVKKIFGSEPAGAPAPAADSRPEGDFGRPGDHRRRRHRGGRGRHFRGDQQGSREGQPGGQYSGEPRGQGGEHSHYGRRRRRRHRGGGGGGGGYRGDARPEGGPPAGS